MTIKLLGTGAADGIPGIFTSSEVSRRALQPGSKDCRTRAAALIDDCIKLDLGPDTLAQIQRHGLDPTLWDSIVFTHSHEDHFTVSEIQYALYPFNPNEYTPFTIYCNPTIAWLIWERYPDWPLDVVTTEVFKTFNIGNYRMTPVLAKHAEPEECQNLIFEKDGRRFGYMTDTGWWPEITWEYLQNARLDAMVIECTDGLHDSGYDGHLALEELVGVVERLRKSEALAPNAPILTTHHSHLGGFHEELEAAMAPHGIQPGFDGLEISI
jgi:phosphoribosyl 1,2-cyclic phosphate phosphodiesterase